MNREMGLSLRSWVSDIAIVRMIRGELAIGAYLTPQTSHEGSWCQASMGPALLVLFQTQINCSPM